MTPDRNPGKSQPDDESDPLADMASIFDEVDAILEEGRMNRGNTIDDTDITPVSQRLIVTQLRSDDEGRKSYLVESGYFKVLLNKSESGNSGISLQVSEEELINIGNGVDDPSVIMQNMIGHYITEVIPAISNFQSDSYADLMKYTMAHIRYDGHLYEYELSSNENRARYEQAVPRDLDKPFSLTYRFDVLFDGNRDDRVAIQVGIRRSENGVMGLTLSTSPYREGIFTADLFVFLQDMYAEALYEESKENIAEELEDRVNILLGLAAE